MIADERFRLAKRIQLTRDHHVTSGQARAWTTLGRHDMGADLRAFRKEWRTGKVLLSFSAREGSPKHLKLRCQVFDDTV
ncbi:hypothetical protein [Actinokineospora iranica]|uniref:hypothetical protein n=1 Tax=Actinokineospora iranica TaxID=1271860 RepID=UPI0011139599|nr:hypothetical protein [Actinokineospora iranica]